MSHGRASSYGSKSRAAGRAGRPRMCCKVVCRRPWRARAAWCAGGRRARHERRHVLQLLRGRPARGAALRWHGARRPALRVIRGRAPMRHHRGAQGGRQLACTQLKLVAGSASAQRRLRSVYLRCEERPCSMSRRAFSARVCRPERAAHNEPVPGSKAKERAHQGGRAPYKDLSLPGLIARRAAAAAPRDARLEAAAHELGRAAARAAQQVAHAAVEAFCAGLSCVPAPSHAD